jgi:hypothetical protein
MVSQGDTPKAEDHLFMKKIKSLIEPQSLKQAIVYSMIIPGKNFPLVASFSHHIHKNACSEFESCQKLKLKEIARKLRVARVTKFEDQSDRCRARHRSSLRTRPDFANRGS